MDEPIEIVTPSPFLYDPDVLNLRGAGAPTPLSDRLDELRAAVDDFEPHADFRLLRAARALLAAADGA